MSDDETTISRHFGRASQYVIVTIEHGQETEREVRAKITCHGHHHTHSAHEEPTPQADTHHNSLLDPISDCQMVVVGGMGAGVDKQLRVAGITPIRTRIVSIDQGIAQALHGQLTDMIELVH
ncbi:MAG: hypothetical protein HGA19_23720 [Oscillochloris sp.]|nr:hypothetical protein [Oscillochloris sp.]